MAETTWTKPQNTTLVGAKSNRLKFVVGGVLLLVAISFLVVNAMSGNTQLYKTVDEFYADQSRLTGQNLTIAGFVIGDTVQYTQLSANSSRLEFDIVDNREAPGQRLHVVALNEPKPDLLQDHAQALVDGHVGPDGVFMVNSGGLLLKCPTKYEELTPAP